MVIEERVAVAQTSVTVTCVDSISNLHEGQDDGEFMYTFMAIGSFYTSAWPEAIVKVSLDIEMPLWVISVGVPLASSWTVPESNFVYPQAGTVV